ncbi:hypothetical protein Dda_0017 [Drechslerella dactyloides]|uniref:Transposase Tc1-like domain-containing protein n=1 Tax=Drechslerella dactyloides TaxID=74499 RepID=A0AAD6J5Y1_DREDA|nr:hypothetical protein Dda_2884 [Drechslerella dactyloides]KAJ6263880.1 hypothetical protein Dda_0017 [Drechslerella dactyloides]
MPPQAEDTTSDRYSTLCQRIQILTLLGAGGKQADVAARFGVSRSAVARLLRKAKDRGYNPQDYTSLTMEHVVDEQRAGRPKKVTQAKEQEVVSIVTKDRSGRSANTRSLAGTVKLSHQTVSTILRRNKFKKLKPTRKPGLTPAIRQARLDFALRHKGWTLEDWKQVIWSDETSVVLGQRRGSYKLWRQPHERYHSDIVSARWHKANEFMFWGCYTWDAIGPCHIWEPETKEQKKAAKKAIAAMNSAAEPKAREEWELLTAMRRTGLRNKPGKKPQWTFDKAHGALERGTGKGIDWYRYQTEVMIPKLIPFAKDCKAKYGRDYIVQEDKAPCHNHHAQEAVYNLHAVSRLLWPGNSPDLNMIEPAWYYLKRRISRHGAPTKREDMEKAWLTEWRQLPIARIRLWIARIVRHIQLVIKLYGGNEYKEGTTDDIVGRPDLIAAVRSNCPVPWGKGRLGPGEACK